MMFSFYRSDARRRTAHLRLGLERRLLRATEEAADDKRRYGELVLVQRVRLQVRVVLLRDRSSLHHDRTGGGSQHLRICQTVPNRRRHGKCAPVGMHKHHRSLGQLF